MRRITLALTGAVLAAGLSACNGPDVHGHLLVYPRNHCYVVRNDDARNYARYQGATVSGDIACGPLTQSPILESLFLR